MSVDVKNQLAVALHYDKTGAPRVIAKGKGPIGAKIIAVARAHDIPSKRKTKCWPARSRTSKSATRIPQELYKAVGGSADFRAAAVGTNSLAALCESSSRDSDERFTAFGKCPRRSFLAKDPGCLQTRHRINSTS